MAFRQPTFVPASRPNTSHEPEHNTTATPISPSHNRIEDSQEWILFPSAQTESTTQTQTSTERTPRTAGLSRLSDFGSLTARSRPDDAVACEATDGSIEGDEDLDSLDDGLHAFQEPAVCHRSGYFDQSGSILPRHDGLGTFPATSPPLQEQLWHFEQYNPRKRSVSGHQRRRSSVQRRFDALEDKDAAMIEGDRRERIEKWRLEHSRVLLNEIEQETRKRRTSVASQRAERTPSSAGLERIIKESVHVQTQDHSKDEDKEARDLTVEDGETFWQRITRRVIRDFIGIDDSLLSVIFGESLAEDTTASSHSSGMPPSKSLRLDTNIATTTAVSWEGRLLERLTRELGILVQHLSDHPGAFSTPYNPSTSDYAGMPVTVPTSSKTQPKLSKPPPNLAMNPTTSFNFHPTLQDAPLTTPTSTDSAHAALWGIEEEPSSNTEKNEREYWEQTPDIKTVFRFLHNRFTSERRPSAAAKPPSIATTSTPDSLRRAAVIRQYHPLVSRAAATWDQRHGHARRHSLLRGRAGSSCASSIVGSARRGAALRGSSVASSSRNYWDLGVSGVGSGGGSAIVAGGMGAWGEV
jgi:hypothetical protein